MEWFGMDVGNNNELWRNTAQKYAIGSFENERQLGDSPRAAPWIVVDALYSATYEHSKLEKAPNAKEDGYLI
jgi:hypothetical protein